MIWKYFIFLEKKTVMETDGIISLAKAHTYLQTITSNEHILDEIRNIIYTWNYKSEYNLNAIKNDLDNIIDKVICQYCDEIYSKEVFKAVHWSVFKRLLCGVKIHIVYNEIYENLIPLVRGKFSKEDLFLYEKCQSLCKLNVTPGQFGSSVYNSLSFTAAFKLD
ncbi:hypothetical protein NQ317_007056 [Molorchus minor]|uniref:Uncharacterized protein n=1 Tax=Molorchus minor TaxID=1323400 RepID=A0ABQ9K3U2_9CUCU|nr:hypothetical protein NQ317_007056 [Molorchus minor]